ncbi:MAG: PIN domain-containing protein [Candidatus Woesearchaeota archaeon]|jgi:predicted nucleic acid-binding protein|nr:PIN domain-containing protein [Candidatus Woesearchaeota archaeon]MDP7457570.1 PIN domain-containing protein [Candidatus Woesearchaeota archaeon]|tara:strand:+ start:1213 stop:1590 length:378 start_codon:yes stop_codon:yes gene_type:complete
MSDKFLLDTSAWLAYFYGDNKTILNYVESESILLSSVISILELRGKLVKAHITKDKIKKVMEFMSKRSIMIDATQEICEEASLLSFDKGLATIDSIIYTSALKNDSFLLTTEKGLKNKKNVLMID